MRIEITNRPELGDGRLDKLKSSLSNNLPGLIRELRIVDVYCVPEYYNIDAQTAASLFQDTVAQQIAIGSFTTAELDFEWDLGIEIAFKAGVTDPVGITATEALRVEKSIESRDTPLVQSARQYLFKIEKKLSVEERTALSGSLFNPLIQRIEIIERDEFVSGKRFPEIYKGVKLGDPEAVVSFDIAAVTDEELLSISKDRLLALTLEEMKVVQNYYRDPAVRQRRIAAGIGERATDVELEMIGQSWSEHCKHKIFAAEIEYTEPGNEGVERIPGLFSTYIRKTTEDLKPRREDLRSMFHDNAGVVDFDDEHVVCFKVETHNSPSALDPYGGAITGIVGVNRDILGTGKGAKPIFNTDYLCFADPETPAAEVPKGLSHPKKIMHGVHEGIIDGGNQSGIPTVAGGFLFDESYLGKPLVYCGTGGIMPRTVLGEESWIKHIDAGDLAVMVGGRIGKDGIHGATFSSLALDEESPSSAVQIGDPITQRKVWDFLIEARDLGLYKGITDNGAGGLSSSLGEMAQSSGGVRVQLDVCPLKYPGLAPWEIWVSESQERMSLAVDASRIADFLALAKDRSVEATVVGTFTDDGYIDIRNREERVALLEMSFIHDGLPKMKLKAVWQDPVTRGRLNRSPDTVTGEAGFHGSVEGQSRLKKMFFDILSHPNVRSKESLVRQYDHEVQGATLVKPYTGREQDAPSDGGLVRPVFGSHRGLSVTHGVCPRVGDDDTYKMAVSAVDEAYRAHIALGGDPDKASALDNFCWPDPVATAENRDGEYKLAQLVRANKGLRDACLAYGLPLISGKDSMKNDARVGGKKISVRPTLLISLMGIVPDTRIVPSNGFVREGDSIFLVGITTKDLGGSVLEHLAVKNGLVSEGAGFGAAPTVDLKKSLTMYKKISGAIRAGIVASIHDLSDGGLGVATVESCFHNRLGCEIDLRNIDGPSEIEDLGGIATLLFSEAPARFVVSVSRSDEARFLEILQGEPVHKLGKVTDNNRITFTHDGLTEGLSFEIDEALSAWKRAW